MYLFEMNLYVKASFLFCINKLALNSRYCYDYIPNAEIASVCHQASQFFLLTYLMTYNMVIKIFLSN